MQYWWMLTFALYLYHPVVPSSLWQCGGDHKTPRTEPGMGKLFAIKVHGSKGTWKKNFLQAFKRFVTFWGFTEVKCCFPTSGIFLLFRLMASVIPSEVFPPHWKGQRNAIKLSWPHCVLREEWFPPQNSITGATEETIPSDLEGVYKKRGREISYKGM